MPEIGLYDDRNRFVSPDLGRFLQADPIGFKGDASNLYRYCGNDWANRVDPTGMAGEEAMSWHYQEIGVKTVENAKDDSDHRGEDLLEYAMINVGRINVRSLQDLNQGFAMNGTGHQATAAAITGQISRPAQSSTQGVAPSEKPGRFDMIKSATQNFGHYKFYHAQLETPTGGPLRIDGYSVNEHLKNLAPVPKGVKFLSSEKEFVPMGKGEMIDRVGLVDPPSRNLTLDVRRLQTFTVRVGGQNYPISTEYEQHISVANGAVQIEVTTIKP